MEGIFAYAIGSLGTLEHKEWHDVENIFKKKIININQYLSNKDVDQNNKENKEKHFFK